MKNQKRGKNVAIVALILQTLLVGSCLAMWRWTQAESLLSAALMAAGGILVWAIVALLFYARELVETEQLELAQVESEGAASSLFDEADRLASRPARAKLEKMEKWFLPIFTILLAGYYIGIGWWLLSILGPVRHEAAAPIPTNPHSGLLLIVLGFGGFLWSRYALGMSTQEEWRPLRSAASLLFVHVLFLLLIVVEMALIYWGRGSFSEGHLSLDILVAKIFPLVMFVFAVEILVNLVLDMYRPRVPGQESRISFDSRLFNFLAQPEQVGHSLAEALNYQFGFEVSRTWFYQLLHRYFLPLLIFPVVVLLLMSCFVYVHDDQKAVVLRLGQLDTDNEPLGPGLHLKLPWPIDKARYFDTGDIKQIILGVNKNEREEYARNIYTRGGSAKRVLLWKEEHEGEKSIMLAQPIREDQARAAAGAALGKIVAEISYRITDVYTYGFRYQNPDQVLENLIAAELTELLASATLMEEFQQRQQMDSDHPRSIMTEGRGPAAKALRDRIEDALSEVGGLGIEITHVGLPSVHPPSAAAPAYEDVVDARLNMLVKIYEAEGEAARMLAEVAGDPLVGRLLAQEIDTLQKVAELNRYLSSTPPDLAEFEKAIDVYIHQASQVLEMYRRQIEREKLLGRLKPSRIDEVKEKVAAGKASLEDLARAEVNDALVMWLVYQRQQELLEGIRRNQQENQLPGLDELLARTERRIYELFEEASGEPAELIATARAERRKLELTERTRAESFKRRLTAWRASPYMYELDRRLEIIERMVPQLDLENKIVIGIDPEKVQVWSDRRQQGEALSEIPWGKPEENEE